MIQGRYTARSAALRGNGWKASAGFSIPGIKKSTAKMIRESRLHAAIRRMKYAQETTTADKERSE